MILCTLGLYFKDRKLNIYFCLVWFFILSVVLGFRIPELGTDTSNYMSIYQSGTFREPVFSAFISLLKNIGVPGDMFIFILTSMTVCLYVVFSYRFSKETVLLSLVFITASYTLYSFSVNIVRQGIAVGFFSLACLQLSKKRYIDFSVLGFLSVSFHLVSIYALVASVIINRTFDSSLSYKKLILGFVIYISCILIANPDVILALVNKLPLPSHVLGMFDRYFNYWSRGDVGPWVNLSSFIPFILYYVCINMKMENESHKSIINIYFFLFISVSPFIYVHLIYSRMAWYSFYLEPCIIACLVYMIMRKFECSGKGIVILLCFVISFIYLAKTYFITGRMLREVPYGQILF
ncbi:EpsG family protein [Vibrio coralliirubri]|uniref:EpsG family protein n=1 Tax=Vibrio coralliirubri TaxID=1516159 RepID=UPI001F4D3100|nr:EpsG family protein [Vibrio coralliirubri]